MSKTVKIPIKGFEGRYLACSDGTIYSELTDKRLKPKKQNSGYLTVCLIDDSATRNYFLVHRLICSAFHGDRAGMHVNHINADKTDNRPENLEWCTREENMRHAINHGLMENQHRAVAESNRKRSQAVVGLKPDGTEVIRFSSVVEARANGYAKVSEVINGKRKTAGGLVWKRA